jgi:bifunctional non-homologous end joining protein LigD
MHEPKPYSQTYHVSGNQKFSKYIKPMLAKLHDAPFNDKNWVYEIKWDGYRAIAEINKAAIRLYSRNGLSFASDYPAVYEELKKIKKSAVLDGEIVVLDKDGKPSFQLIQQYAQDKSLPICYYVFDCLYIDGKSIEDKPLRERKDLLKKILPKSNVIRYCDHIEEKGKDFFALIQKKGLEGMIAKRADSAYVEGARSSDWLKVKNVIMEEAVIAGYTEPRGGRKYFGALVLGMYKKGRFVYIGHTGTGFSDNTLKDLYDKLQLLKTDKSPFETQVSVNAPVTWVKPKLVCNLKYSEITEDGRRRHPVFMGLRIDKAPKDVREEVHDVKSPNKKKS